MKNIYNYMNLYILFIILACVFNVRIKSYKYPNNILIKYFS
jgi:hypothetical protein